MAPGYINDTGIPDDDYKWIMDNFPCGVPDHVALKEIDKDHWVISDRLLLSRQPLASTTGQPCWWDDLSGQYFVLSETDHVPSNARPLSPTSDVKSISHAGAGTAISVWKAGEAYIKVKTSDHPEVTREHATLDWLHSKGPLSFEIPKYYYHGEFHGHYFIITRKIPGQTLEEAWPDMDEEMRDKYGRRIAEISLEMAQWTNNAICGADGGWLGETYLDNRPGFGWGGIGTGSCPLDPETLLRHSLELGLDCRTFVFHHCYMCPEAIIINPNLDGSVGIVEWDIAGFVPRGWVPTKCIVSAPMLIQSEIPEKREAFQKKVYFPLQGMELFRNTHVADAYYEWDRIHAEEKRIASSNGRTAFLKAYLAKKKAADKEAAEKGAAPEK